MKVALSILITICLIIFWSCSKDADPIQSVTHPPGWTEQGTDNFHGKKVFEIKSEFCTSCHGDDYSGGESGVACADCHADYPHPPTWITPGSDGSHVAYIRDQNWSMDRCKTCHGDNYRGGSSGDSCFRCHLQTGGPEACNTCHGSSAGSVSNILTWAPPKDLNDNIETIAIGVGAHQNHLSDSTLTKAWVKDCNLCHPNILTFDDSRHIDDDPGITMEFNEVATDSGRAVPVWNVDEATCASVYCHGNFSFSAAISNNSWGYLSPDTSISGNNVTIDWTLVGSGEADCGTCHDLPPKGHIQVVNCEACHGEVVDANLNIIDKTKHINGKYNIQGQSYRP